MRMNRYELKKVYAVICSTFKLLGDDVPHNYLEHASGAELMELYFFARKLGDSIDEFYEEYEFLEEKIKNSNRKGIRDA